MRLTHDLVPLEASLAPTHTSHALREWAVVCDALMQGQQHILLRKGGIHEPAGAGRFQPHAQPFALFPTVLHQRGEDLKPSFGLRLLQPSRHWGDGETVQIRCLAATLAVLHCQSRAALAALDDLHIYSPRTIDERFSFRRPGLWVIAVRIQVLPSPKVLIWSLGEGHRSCASWLSADEPDEVTSSSPTHAGQQKTVSDAAVPVEDHRSPSRPRIALPPELMAAALSAEEERLIARLDQARALWTEATA